MQPFLVTDRIRLQFSIFDLVNYDMKLSDAFKQRLETYLKEKNLSIHKFAKDSCVARSTIVNLLTGNSKSPTLATLYQVADGLGVTVLEFLDCDLFRESNIEIE